MAEFQEVMRQYNRMCEYMMDHNKKKGGCVECPVSSCVTGSGDACTGTMYKQSALFEKAVMVWATEHPEPAYPSWNEAWRQMFPNAVEKSPPCLRYFVNDARFHESCVFDMSCEDCRNKPMFADIAEKLGIKPVEVTK